MAAKPKPETDSKKPTAAELHEAAVAEKVKAGLTRKQAEKVLKDQAEFDKSTKAKA